MNGRDNTDRDQCESNEARIVVRPCRHREDTGFQIEERYGSKNISGDDCKERGYQNYQRLKKTKLVDANESKGQV